MTQPGESVQRTPFSVDPHQIGGNKIIPLLSSSATSSESPQGDPMDITPPVPTTMGPPVHSSPEIDQGNANTNPSFGSAEANMNHVSPGFGLGAAAAAATQQPKVVQTAFIHKLYNMLEDPSIQHLISWSNTNESFVMSPSNEFSKVLSQYFKHTNISSFVRQLNMYGFHKVSDVFHTGSPESTLWEFKHGNGNFKRGDLVGLREIKRRASRHALIHRDSFSSAHKASASSPGTPAEVMPDTADSRMASLEHTLYELSARLSRSEENYAVLSSRYQSLTEGLLRCHHWNHDLSHFLTALIPDPEAPVHREIQIMQKEIVRQTEMLRSLEEPPETLLSGRQSYFSALTLDSAPLSPRQLPQDDSRRPMNNSRQNFFRPPVPPHLAMPPRRYGSVGAANSSPGSLRAQAPPPAQPIQHPLASVSSPPTHLSRRHTSADIRLHGWQNPGGSPFGSGQSSTQWPSSPNRTPNAESHQQVRDVLAQYEIQPRASFGSRQTTPPLAIDTTPSTTSAESGWSFQSKFPPKATDTPGPPTRRSSMASNVHSLLNPAETAERDEGDVDAMNEDRKRKRLQ